MAFDKHPELVIHLERPLNAGPPLSLLRSAFQTPSELFFLRTHGSVPQLDPEHYQLKVHGLVDRDLELSLSELRSFEWHELPITLQCAGLRRNELLKLGPLPGELPWGGEAISTAAWGGIRLRDVLLHAGIRDGAQHVAFLSHDRVERDGRRFAFGGSIPLAKALEEDVLLALDMNNAPLPLAHGFPLRLVVPGYIGARSVKWLAAIELRDTPSDNYFQQRAYRLWRGADPHAPAEPGDGAMLGPVRLNALICEPAPGSTLRAGPCLVQGYALPNAGAQLTAVELSTDGGTTWQPASVERGERWTWSFWSIAVQLEPGNHELVVRASDTSDEPQPEALEQVWNRKGYLNNAWQRVPITVRGYVAEENAMELDKIRLEGMAFVGFHGTRPEEGTLGQRFVVDIELHCDLRAACQSDDLRLSVDYSEVHAIAREVVEGPKLNLTEAVAEQIAQRVLAEQAQVQAVRVTVRKPWVRLDTTMLEGSVVEILRRRS